MKWEGKVKAKNDLFEAKGYINYNKSGHSFGEIQGNPGELMQIFAELKDPNDSIETNIGEIILISNIGDERFRFELKGEPKGPLKKEIRNKS